MHNLFGTLLFTLTFVYCLPFVDEIENDESTSNLFTLYTHDIHLIQTFSHVVENITRQYGKARDIDPFLFSINQSSCPNYDPSKSCLIHLLPLEHDRSCLIKPPHPPTRGKSFFQGVFDEDNIYKFITTAIGISLEAQKLSTSKYKLISPHHQCDRIKLSELTMEDMVSKYWLPQKPLIIENFLNPLNSTDIEAILRMNGNIRVGAKLSYSGEFEGIDDIQNWKSSIQNIPLSILQQLESPDLVVVRPAHKEITIQNFLENLRSKSATQANSDFEYQFPSIYIEYLPIQENKELLFLTNQLLGQPPHSTDLLVSLGSKFPFLKYLANGNAYLWIGDGATIGKLHFDPFENLLIQVQ